MPELFGAVGTVVGLLSGVDLHVVIERGHLPETNLTDLALIRLLARMRFDVIDQGALLGEEAPADATPKRPIRIVAFQHIYIAYIQPSTLSILVVFDFSVGRRCRCYIAGHHRTHCRAAIEEV